MPELFHVEDLCALLKGEDSVHRGTSVPSTRASKSKSQTPHSHEVTFSAVLERIVGCSTGIEKPSFISDVFNHQQVLLSAFVPNVLRNIGRFKSVLPKISLKKFQKCVSLQTVGTKNNPSHEIACENC
jgi:hypothetical protein